MINLYTLLAAIFLIIVPFRLYLLFTDQHVHFHYQNTSNEKKPEPTWRNGRCWWSLYYNDANKGHRYYPGPGLNLSWYLWKLSPIGFGVDQAGDEFDIKFDIAFLFGRIWITLEGTRFFRWLYKRVYRMGWGYSTDIALHLGYLGQWEFVTHFLYNDMASGPGLRIKLPKWKWLYNRERRRILRMRWSRDAKRLNLMTLRNRFREGHIQIDPLPNGIHFWWAVDYIKGSMPTGGGWRLSIDFDRIIRGSYEREERQIEGTILNVEVPIEPDNSLGLRYLGTFTRMEETRWRSHWPWNKKKSTQYWKIEFKNPPMHAGKGENSWDLDDDGIMGCSALVETLQEAIKDYQERVYRDRKKYGMPDVIYKAQRGAS